MRVRESGSHRCLCTAHFSSSEAPSSFRIIERAQFIHKQVEFGSFFIPCKISHNSLSLSQHTKRSCRRSSIMEGNGQLQVQTMNSKQEKYSKEMEVAVKAVQMVCSLCQRVQQRLLFKPDSIVHSKDGNSVVTIADWSVQATVSWVLSESFGSKNVSIVAEEDVETLSKSEATSLLESVVQTVNECLAEAPQVGLKGPRMPLGKAEVVDAIRKCNSIGGSRGRFWVLDPVDGTLGFVHGDQYTIALALVEDGEVVVGAPGCPNYPLRKDWLSYRHRYYRIISKLTSPSSSSTCDSWDKGFVLYARKE